MFTESQRALQHFVRGWPLERCRIETGFPQFCTGSGGEKELAGRQHPSPLHEFLSLLIICLGYKMGEQITVLHRILGKGAGA